MKPNVLEILMQQVPQLEGPRQKRPWSSLARRRVGEVGGAVRTLQSDEDSMMLL